MLAGCVDALEKLLEASRDMDIIGVVGMPLTVNGKLYNVAVVFKEGVILGVVPVSYTHLDNKF